MINDTRSDAHATPRGNSPSTEANLSPRLVLTESAEGSHDAAGFFAVDHEGRLTYINVPDGRLLDRPADELVGTSVWTVFTGAVGTLLRSACEKALRERVNVHCEALCSPPGAWYEFHVYPNPGGFATYFQDITLRKQADDERDRYFALSPDLLSIVTSEGMLRQVNPAWERMLGYAEEELRGHPLLLLVHPDDQAQTRAHLRQVIFDERNVSFANRCRAKDGSYLWLQWSVTPCAEKGVVYATARDITELKKSEESFRWQANHDPLTGLPNRHLFEDRLGRAIAVAQRRNTRVALLFIDLDCFKPINDAYGHAVGDLLLQQIATQLSGCLRGEDTVARLGGDEFVALLPGVDRPQDTVKVAMKLLQVLNGSFHIDGHDLYVTASVGISIFPFDGATPDALLRNADVAMYRAKKQGRGGYALFTEAMNESALERLVMESSLSQAIERGELRLHYQPQISVQTGKVTGVEALVRWEHPSQGLIYPLKFIPLAEETGLILPIGRWVSQEACRQATAWKEMGLPVGVAINISALQLADTHLAEQLQEDILAARLAPAALDLELTETTFIKKEDSLSLEALQRLKSLGVRLSVDDFGTGYSSLSYLRRFPLDGVKVDRSFVTNIVDDAADEAVVHAVIDLSHTLGLKVIAEGVETAAQRERLRSLGCDTLQGYYISEPLPADEATALLAERNRRHG